MHGDSACRSGGIFYLYQKRKKTGDWYLLSDSDSQWRGWCAGVSWRRGRGDYGGGGDCASAARRGRFGDGLSAGGGEFADAGAVPGSRGKQALDKEGAAGVVYAGGGRIGASLFRGK